MIHVLLRREAATFEATWLTAPWLPHGCPMVVSNRGFPAQYVFVGSMAMV